MTKGNTDQEYGILHVGNIGEGEAQEGRGALLKFGRGCSYDVTSLSDRAGRDGALRLKLQGARYVSSRTKPSSCLSQGSGQVDRWSTGLVKRVGFDP